MGEAVARLGGAAAPAGPVAPPPVTLPEPSDDAPPRPDDRVHATPPHRQEITVINKVPATFLYILKEQFGLMQRWLEPITRLAAGQEAKLEQVAAAIADLTAQYERTIERLENSRDQSLEE